MYDNGLGVLQDYKEVVQWYRLAAEHHGVAGHLQGAEHQQEAPTAVLSDECELVSARTMKPPVMPHRVDATQQERRFG